MELQQSKMQVLNRDVIKYIAMAAMFLNHFAAVFLEYGTLLHDVFEYIGYFTAITMCYFLVEGYEYTRSKKQYGIRLFLFAVISQIPFSYAFHFGNLNMIFTLFICFMILVAREKIQNNALQTIVVTLLVLITAFGDWPFLAAIFTILFANYKNDRKKMMMSYGAAFFLFAAFNVMNGLAMGKTITSAILSGGLSGIALLVSGAVIMFFYNGKRTEHGQTFSKWFFYLFYPGHLLILGLIHSFMQ